MQQLLLKSIPSCFELKCRAYSLLSQCYHLVGAVPSQKQLLNKGLELTASFGDKYACFFLLKSFVAHYFIWRSSKFIWTNCYCCLLEGSLVSYGHATSIHSLQMLSLLKEIIRVQFLLWSKVMFLLVRCIIPSYRLVYRFVWTNKCTFQLMIMIYEFRSPSSFNISWHF